jgi:N-acetylglutamate synthase-like GNAT family acetyltransferase
VSGPATPKLRLIPLASWERGGVTAALKRLGLPAADVEEPGHLFWRFETADTVPVGFAGLEIHRPYALLHSIVTLPPLRGRGFGHAIVREVEAQARIAGCDMAWLLTTSPDYFAHLGYIPSRHEDVPEPIRATQQYAVLCSSSATVMAKPLV